MTAPALPLHVVGPERSSFTTGDGDAKWVTVKDGVATEYTTSGTLFWSHLNFVLGVPGNTPTARTLSRLREMMGRQAQTWNIGTVLNREVLRAAVWYYMLEYANLGGTPGTTIWFPLPLAGGDLGMTMPRESFGRLVPRQLSPTTTPATGGSSTPPRTSTTTPATGGSSTTPPPVTSSGSPIIDAAQTGFGNGAGVVLGGLAATALVGALVLIARRKNEKNHPKGRPKTKGLAKGSGFSSNAWGT